MSTDVTGRPADLGPFSSGEDIAIVGDKIKIGSKLFRVKMSDQVITQQEMLARVRGLIEKHFSKESFESAFQTLALKNAAAPTSVKIVLSRDGAKVYRYDAAAKSVSLPSGQSVDVACKPQVKVKGVMRHDTLAAYAEKLGKVQKELTAHVNFSLKLQSDFARKGYTKEQVSSAIDSIFDEGHLSLLAFMQGKQPSEWGEKTIADLLHEPGNEGLRAALLSMKTAFSPPTEGRGAKDEECIKDLQLFILKNLQRNPKIVKMEKGGQLRQQFVKGEAKLQDKIKRGDLISIKDIGDRARGWPSEQDKGDYRKDIVACNTNLGSIIHQTSDGARERVVVMRSGKSDTFERLKENALEACLQQLSCKEPSGFVTLGPDLYEFQHAITSYLDPSKLKALGADNEREFLHQIIAELEKWPEDGLQVNVSKPGGGKLLIILKRPIICNQLLSTTVRGVGTERIQLSSMGQEHSDEINFIANHQLFERYVAQHPELNRTRPSAPSLELEAKIQKELGIEEELPKFNGFLDLGKLSTSRLLETSAIFRSPQMANYKRYIGEFLVEAMRQNEQDLALRGLFALFFRTDPQNLDSKGELHAADLEIWRDITLRSLNLSSCKQCKSGTDRTAIGVALASAQEMFRQKFAKPYIPDDMRPEELLWFKKLFREALKELGVSMVTETKGYSGLKWGGGVPFMGGISNPVAYKYLYLTEDIKGLKSHGIDVTRETPDVENLTYEDLFAKGKKQYRGKLIDPRAIHGKSDTAHAKAVKNLQKKLPEQQRREAAKNMEDFLIIELGLSGLQGKQLFNDQLQLALHVRNLRLDVAKLKVIDTKTQGLQAKDRTPQENLQLYMLHQIKTLWNKRQESKKISALKSEASQPKPKLSKLDVVLEE